MFIPLSPDKYAAALKGLEAARGGGDLLSFETSGPNGIIKTKDIDLGFSYSAEKQELAITILAKHTMKAKLAPDSVIQKHVEDLLAKVEG